ncbi:MAG: ribosome maturation factor RimM [bacterium]
MSISDDGAELVTVGLIGKAHGLRGEVAVQPWTDDPAGRFRPGTQFKTAAREPAVARQPAPEPPGPPPRLTIAAARQQSGRWLVAFAEVEHRDAAEALRGTRLLLPATARPPLEDPDEFYDTDLIGLRVEDPAGRAVGQVREMVHGPAGDLLAVIIDDQEHLIPFVRAIVPRVDVAGGVVVVDAPKGLFDL